MNPFAQTNWPIETDELYKIHEKQKKDAYMARILQVEKGSFTPLIFTCTGGAGPEATKFLKNLAVKLSNKRLERYSETVRRRLRFDILKTCVISLRGERSKRGLLPSTAPVGELELELSPMHL